MMKRLLIGLSLLLVTASLPIAPAIAESELLEQAKADLKAAKATVEALGGEKKLAEQAASGLLDIFVLDSLAKGKVQAAIDQLNNFRKKYPDNPYSYLKMGEIKEEYQQDLPGAFKEYEQAFIKAQQKKDEDETIESANKAVNVLLIAADVNKDANAFRLADKFMASIQSYRRTPEGDVNRARGAEILLLQKPMSAKDAETLKQNIQQRFDQVIKARPKLAYAYLHRGIFRARILKDNAGAKADLQLANELAKGGLRKAVVDRSSAALKALEGMTEASAPTVPTAKAAVTAPKTAAPATQQLHFSQVSTQARASYDRGLAKFNQQDFKGAIAEFDQALKAQPNYPEAFNWRGNAHGDLGNAKQALADYDQAIQLKSDYSRPYNNRGLVKGRLGDMEGAMSDLNTAIRLEPTLAIAYDNRGFAKGSLGDTEGAISDLNTAIRLEPTLAQAYNNRGSIFIKQGKTDAALKDFRQAVQMAPKNGSFYSNLCRAELANYNEQAGFDACDRAISLGYEHPVAYTNRGVARLRLKDPKAKAIADFDQAIKLDPEEAAAYFNRGHQLILTDPSKRQAGIRDLETALRLSKKQGGQSKEWIQNLEQEIASFKSPGSKPAQTKRSETAKDSTSDDDQSEDFFAELTELLNQPKKK